MSSPGGPGQREPEVTYPHFLLRGLRGVRALVWAGWPQVSRGECGILLLWIFRGRIEGTSYTKTEGMPPIPDVSHDWQQGQSSVGSPVFLVGSPLRMHSGFLSWFLTPPGSPHSAYLTTPLKIRPSLPWENQRGSKGAPHQLTSAHGFLGLTAEVDSVV